MGILVFTVTKGVQCLFNYVQEQIFLEQLILWKITHHVHKYGCTVRYFFTLRNNTVQLSTMDVVFGGQTAVWVQIACVFVGKCLRLDSCMQKNSYSEVANKWIFIDKCRCCVWAYTFSLFRSVDMYCTLVFDHYMLHQFLTSFTYKVNEKLLIFLHCYCYSCAIHV